MKTLIITMLLCLAVLRCSAQSGSAAKQDVERRISDFFMEDNGIFDRAADSGMLYTFFFQINVNRDKNGKTSAVSIEASDSLACQLFPRYRVLKDLPFDIYMKDRKKASFIIPVILDVISSTGETYKNERLAVLKSYRKLFSNDENLEQYIYFKPTVFMISKQVFD